LLKAEQFTQNAGYGGQTAVESAAQLANLLYDATQAKGQNTLELAEITEIFKKYRIARKVRVDNAFHASGLVTRMHATENSLLGVAGRHILPFLGEAFEVNGASSFMIGGPSLKFVEKKGKTGVIPWEGWDPDTIIPHSRTTFYSMAKGMLPLVALALWSLWNFWTYSQVWNPWVKFPSMDVNYTSTNLASQSGTTLVNGMSAAEAYQKMSQDLNVWTLINWCMNILPVGCIIAIESFRKNNTRTLSAK